MANFRFGKVIQENSSSGKRFGAWEDRLVASFIIKSKLTDVEFPKQSAKKEAVKNSAFQDFCIMYEWLKECINKAELTESKLRNDPAFMITQKLNTMYCNCASTEAIEYLANCERLIQSNFE